MANGEIQAIIDARKEATKTLSIRRSQLNRKKNAIVLKAAQEHRPPTADEIDAAAECRTLIKELNDTEETLILVTNLELATSERVKALAKELAAANAALQEKARQIKKIVEVTKQIAETIGQISAIVTQLGKLAAAIPH